MKQLCMEMFCDQWVMKFVSLHTVHVFFINNSFIDTALALKVTRRLDYLEILYITQQRICINHTNDKHHNFVIVECSNYPITRYQHSKNCKENDVV